MMFEFIDPLFAGLLGLVIACGLTFVGVAEVLTALLVHRKKAFGNDAAAARKFKPVFIIVLVLGCVIAAVGLYGLNLHFGHRL